MRQHFEADELVEQWGLTEADLALVRNKTGATRLGFAVMLKFFESEGRFPASAGEVPVEVARFIWPLAWPPSSGSWPTTTPTA